MKRGTEPLPTWIAVIAGEGGRPLAGIKVVDTIEIRY